MRRSTRALVAVIATVSVLLFTGCPKEVHEHYYDGEKQEVLTNVEEGSVILVTTVTSKVSVTYDFESTEVVRYTHRTYVPVMLPGELADLKKPGPIANTIDGVVVAAADHYSLDVTSWSAEENTANGAKVIAGIWIAHDPAPPSADIEIPVPPPETVAVDTAK